MKIKIKQVPYAYVENLPPLKKKPLVRPSFLLGLLIRILSEFELASTKFTCTKVGMEKVKNKPCLILMNHSSFLDLKIASKLFFPKPYYIVSTMDGMVGKETLMRYIGCIPTKKFVTDVGLVRDMSRALHKKKTSVLMYPEAGYTFDGRTTVLPKHLGNLIKSLKVPVVTVITDGAFLYQPLYNDLRIRKTPVSARVECMLTEEEIAEKSVDEINALLDKAFSFDNFKTQKELGHHIADPDRAAGLERILYRCPHCQTEGKMVGEKHTLTCHACGKVYEMDELGQLHATSGETEFSHIPDWTKWEQECVKKEVEEGSYRMELDVEIGIIADHKALYMVGDGKFIHDENGYTLTSMDGSLSYTQTPLASYTLNSDFNWYEIGDVIGIGNTKRLYYCFPKTPALVTKARYAAEAMYQLTKK